MERTRLLLVDDHILFREGLSRLLTSEPGLEIAGSCGTAAEALEVLKQTSVDLILLDFDLGGDHVSQLITSARRQGFEGKILMVTAGMGANESSVAIQLGASGIFLKENSPATLKKAIRMIVAGDAWVDEKVMRMLAAAVDENDGQTSAKVLTAREQQVLQGVFEGLTNKEIAAQLGVTESAVKATLQQLFQKTGVRTRSQLVRIALERSLGTSRKL
jgi:two-component system, NarL family, nitrate/nitrite response regulator NarL